MSLGNIVEGIFQSKLDITSSGETKDFDHGFFNQQREYETDKALILKVSFHIFRIRLRGRRIRDDSDWRRCNGTINMAKEILTLKKREKLISPEKIICGGEFNSNHVDHDVEREGRISHEGIEKVNPKKL